FVLPNSTVMPVLRTALAAWLPVGLDLDAVDRLALAADIDADLDTGAFAIRNAEVTLLGAALSAELAAAPNGANRRYSGRLRTSRFEPTALVALLDEHLAAGITPEKLGMLRLQTDFDYDTTTDRLTIPRVAL